MVGEQLRQLRRELAYLDHDLVADGTQAVFYCVRCCHSIVLPLRAYQRAAILDLARRHRARCPDPTDPAGYEAANEGT